MTADLRSQVLQVLAEAGTWVDRPALAHLTTCVPALDDVLADLVVDGRVEHQRFVGYRLAVSALARAALLKLQREPQLRRAVAAKTIEKNGQSQVLMGVAQRCADAAGGVVTFDMALPVCTTPQAALAQAQAWLAFCAKGGLLNG